MEDNPRLRRLRFRAWHRGTKEADLMVGGYFDRYGASFTEADMDLFEQLLEEEDVEIMAWAMGIEPTPERYEGPIMVAMRKLDFVPVEK